MDIKQDIEQQAAARAALLASLPHDVQAALNQLPDAGRGFVLDRVRDLKDPCQASDRKRNSGVYMGAVGYAYMMGQVDNTQFNRLFEFELTLTAAPA